MTLSQTQTSKHHRELRNRISPKLGYLIGEKVGTVIVAGEDGACGRHWEDRQVPYMERAKPAPYYGEKPSLTPHEAPPTKAAQRLIRNQIRAKGNQDELALYSQP